MAKSGKAVLAAGVDAAADFAVPGHQIPRIRVDHLEGRKEESPDGGDMTGIRNLRGSLTRKKEGVTFLLEDGEGRIPAPALMMDIAAEERKNGGISVKSQMKQNSSQDICKGAQKQKVRTKAWKESR